MRKPRVLVVDDESLVLNMLGDFLKMRGYEVLSKADPPAACCLQGRSGPCTYFDPCADVILTDFKMPGLNGVELLERQRRKGCPIDSRNKAVISAYIDEINRKKLQELRCFLLKKPFALSSLSDWLMSCEERMDLLRPLATRRREERFGSFREIIFRLADRDEPVTGIALNISRSGFCLRAPFQLQREDSVQVDAGHFSTCTRASVRWVKPESDGTFLAGLLCC